MFNDLIGKNKELGRFLFCERYTLPPVKNAMYIAEGQELKRGAVVDVNGVLVGTNSLMPYAVLEFDCDTRSGGKEASVFIKGEFNFDKLSFASGLSKSDMDNIVYNGNSVGIVIKPYEYDDGFNPIMAPAGTSQSNPLMTAADTERMIDAMKPIDANTLRFEFSKKDYNPETAGVGSAGTWTKVDSPTLNVWDWTNDATDWSESFMGAFPDDDNEVRVIAAGDTSEVTTIYKMFAGIFTNNPSKTSYSVTTRNNFVSCVPFDVSSCNDFKYAFCCTKLKDIVRFHYNNLLDSISSTFIFADTFIEYAYDLDFYDANVDVQGSFARTKSIRKVSITGVENVTYFNEIFWEPDAENDLEEIKIQGVFDKCVSFGLAFQNNRKLKHSPKIKSNAVSVNCQGIYNQCFNIEDVDLEVNKANRVDYLFNGCRPLKSLPLIDTSTSTHFESMMSNCNNVETIPDYDVSSATTVQNMCRFMYKAKYGILEMYNKLLARGSAITNHTDCFKDCGRDTPEGRAALAQIPQSWGGLAAG